MSIFPLLKPKGFVLFQRYSKRIIFFLIVLVLVFSTSNIQNSKAAMEIVGYPTREANEALIIQKAIGYGITNYNQIAYILATARHETAQFRTLEEFGQGANYPYGVPDPETGQAYYGRGYVQLTWKSNYQKYTDITGRDLVNDPDILIQEPELSAWIMIDGMMRGKFTGARLDWYVNDDEMDFYNARRTVNGTKHADIVEGYAEEYVKNDVGNFEIRTYNNVYKYNSYKALQSTANWNGQKIAGDNTISWGYDFPINFGLNNLDITYNNADGSQEIKELKVWRHKLGDIDGDEKINVVDLSLLAKNWGVDSPQNYMVNMNPDEDTVIDLLDLSIIASQWTSD